MSSRKATHAGSWYHATPDILGNELQRLLNSANVSASGRVKAIISPHAGYRYAGQTASFGYKSVAPSTICRIFILGPCHHTYIEGCAIPDASLTHYETPFGPLPLDMDVLKDLKINPEVTFRSFRLSNDEEEHSIELQLPFLKYTFKDNPEVKIVPIYVGSLVQNEERVFGRLLARYFDDPSTLFVVSSDFCHWGHRFRFAPKSFPRMDASIAPVYAQETMNGNIESLDREGMTLIEKQDIEGFSKYLQTTGNTICGRNPILILLEVLRNARTKCDIQFVHYSQSGLLPPELTRNDSSVSYASAVCYSV
jgi:AmmeMemoRadiSam system protein B